MPAHAARLSKTASGAASTTVRLRPSAPLAHRANCLCPTCAAARTAYDRSQNAFRVRNLTERARLNPHSLPDAFDADGDVVPGQILDRDEREQSFTRLTAWQADKVLGYVLKDSVACFIDNFSPYRALGLFATRYPVKYQILMLRLVIAAGESQPTWAEVATRMEMDVNTVKMHFQHGRFYLQGWLEGFESEKGVA